MLFQAHRGVSTEYPENTIPAFQAALNQGYQIIEMDPTFTADGKCILFHDKTINRTCRNDDGSEIKEEIFVSNLTYDQLIKYDAGLFMGEEFRGTRAPLLKDALDLIVKTNPNVLIKLDNKFERYFTPEQENIFFDIAEKSGARVAYTCIHAETIERVLNRFPNAEIHYDGPVDEETVAMIKAIVKDNPFTVWLALPSHLTTWVKVPMATKELCAAVKKYADLGLWILETQEQLEEAVALGADVIETTGSIKPQ